ncbi:hypothetical protein AQZ49_14445 [Novosphingobium sp. FSW06-99]|nr:hypothetical protein AQZ49_14445 [Novosphingobium sp. FSW06-99]
MKGADTISWFFQAKFTAARPTDSKRETLEFLYPLALSHSMNFFCRGTVSPAMVVSPQNSVHSNNAKRAVSLDGRLHAC